MGADEDRIAHDDQVTGKVIEGFVVMEVLKHSQWARRDARLHHYRQEHDEIDLVLETRSGRVAAVEVQAAATVRAEDFRAMAKLRDARSAWFTAFPPASPCLQAWG